MTDELYALIERLIERYGAWRVALSPLLAVPVLSAVGVIANGHPAAFVALTLALLILLLTAAVLAIQLGNISRAMRRREELIVKFTETVASAEPPPYVYGVWDESVVVSSGGDTVIEQWKEVRVRRRSKLSVLWAGEVQTQGRVTDSQRRGVRVSVHDFVREEDGRRIVGAGYDTVLVWQGNALVVYIYLDQPAVAGQVLNLLFLWEWPGFYRDLVNGGRDEVHWERRRSTIDKLNLTMTFDASCYFERSLKVRPMNGCQSPTQTLLPDGSLRIEAQFGPNLPRVVGFTLDSGAPDAHAAPR